VVLIEGDGRKGLKEYAPYDAIHVGLLINLHIIKVLFLIITLFSNINKGAAAITIPDELIS
jgi:hypothetical protein